MNILLIGNGFDLAHKLPTQYKDFLDFCKGVKCFNERPEEIFLDDVDNVYVKQWVANFASEGTISNGVLNQLLPFVEHNSWLKYFWNCPSYIGENWIDFESEISKVAQILDEVRLMTREGSSVLDVTDTYKASILEAIRIAAYKTVKEVFQSVKLIDEFIFLLENDLKQLIRVLEIYLTEFVGKIKNDVMVSEIEKLDVDCLLSFNYTNTFENKYGVDKKINYNYVHGEAKLSNTIESNNMVLGIDEYLPEDRKNKEFTFLAFKKFYQRLLKATDNEYLFWADEIKDGYEEWVKRVSDANTAIVAALRDGSLNMPHQKQINIEKLDIECPKHTLYIFGHSLDVTDKDILELFICNDNVQTKIYYYRSNKEDKSVLGKLITNLISIIGQEEVIRRTGGSHKTIEFIPQSIEEKLEK